MAQAAKIGSGLRLQGPQDWFEVAHICVCGFGLRQFLVRREDKRTTITAIKKCRMKWRNGSSDSKYKKRKWLLLWHEWGHGLQGRQEWGANTAFFFKKGKRTAALLGMRAERCWGPEMRKLHMSVVRELQSYMELLQQGQCLVAAYLISNQPK